ncbi:outer membrane biogenesis protein BamB [Pirellulimonas nuda]|uniref:Outer membrane biogenesis protein BamB n=1 Tax=Pirellulimonas nuda TaxID=2528009 RepID=A0A518D7N7_9BACT|nr:PQQ-binding-like beta-propeller repeat protein [Pirellulimonas nuda]QDU87481.1 outer membrane biogenesis protein BamB [Pirellulimonas nuda]
MRRLSCYLTLLLLSQTAFADDWPQWQGPDRNAVSRETGLLQEWPEGGPPLAWRVDGLGGGDSAPAVAGGKLYGMSHRDGKEIVWALSEADGKELWASPLGDAAKQGVPQSKEGPGGTPTVEGDRVYVIGMSGRLACLDASDGKIVWQKSLVDDFGGAPPMWSFRESPLVDGDKVICTPGAAGAMLVAVDKTNGEVIWETTAPPAEASSTPPTGPGPPPRGERGPADAPPRGGGFGPPGGNARGGGGRRGGFGRSRSGAAYSSVIAIDYQGSRQYVQMTSTTLVGVSADTGELLWQYNKPANGMGVHCTTPIFQDGLIFAASAYGAGGGAITLNKDSEGKFEPEEVYFTTNMQNHHGGIVVVDGALYGANGGNGGGMMACIDFQTGKTLWRDRKGPKGSLLYADGRIYLRSEEGPIVLLEPSTAGLIEHSRFEQPDRTDAPAWAHPVVANGKLYIRDQGLLLCYDVQSDTP